MDIINVIVLVISLGLESYLLYLLSRRKVWSHFPLFFAFALAAAPATLARLFTVSHYSAYFYVFWSTDLALLILSLTALHEVFHWVYEAFYVFWWFRLLYFGIIASVLLLSARNSFLNPPVQAHPVISLILSVGVAVNLLQAGIAALFAGLTGPLGVPFRRYAFGIVAGFAVSSIGPFIGYFARSVFGTRLETFARYASAVAYILALVIWLAAFSGREPDEKAWNPPLSPEEMLRTVRSYLRALGLGKNDEP
jgi:hypothetical protein